MDGTKRLEVLELLSNNVILVLFALFEGKSYVHRISHDTYLSDGTIRAALKDALRYKIVKKTIEVGPRGRRIEFYELTPAGKELTEFGLSVAKELQARLDKIKGNNHRIQ